MTLKFAEHWGDIFREEFEKESDRACVILSVAMLDRVLETILKARLVPTDSPKDRLLEEIYAPISTFSAKIDLAHRIGLISTQFCRDLHTIRQIRNEFSHNIKGCNFEDSTIRSRILELSRSSGIIDRFKKTRKQSFPLGVRGDFQITISWMLWHLSALAEEVKSIKSAKPEWGYWMSEKKIEDRKKKVKKKKDTGRNK